MRFHSVGRTECDRSGDGTRNFGMQISRERRENALETRVFCLSHFYDYLR